MRIQERINDLSFVIGIFFTIVAVVLFANILIMDLDDLLSMFTAGGFLVFGLLMMFVRRSKT